MTVERGNIVVIGASAGGVEALRKLTAYFPKRFPAPILITLHIGHHRSLLPAVLAANSKLPASHAVDGAELHAGQILVAPPDQHMLVEGRTVRLTRGPKENHTRPAIDPLFRSAALNYGPGAIGVILTGRLDDGTAGLQAIKSCGGIAIVQDPAEAAEPSMPQSALRHVPVDHCVPLHRIADVCASILSKPQSHSKSEPPDMLVHESDLASAKGNPMEHLKQLGAPSTFVCPDCRGSLWEIRGAAPQRFRCHTGHGYTLRTLQHAQSLKTDEALWGALRALQEQKLLLESAADFAWEPAEKEKLAALATQGNRNLEALRVLLEEHESPETS